MKKILGIMAMAFALTSCSSYSLVNSDVYNDADLSAIRTFHIVTPSEGTLPPGMTEVTYYNIAAAIREQLVERGYVEDPNSPILVNIALTVKKEVAYSAFTTPGVWVTPPPMWGGPVPVPPAPGPGPGPAPGPAPAPGPGPAPVPNLGPIYNGMAPFYMYPRSYYYPGTTQIVPSVYREGVLTMDILNIRTKMPLYSSSVATIVDNGDTQFRNLSGIAQAVKVLFSKYPVPILPQYK